MKERPSGRVDGSKPDFSEAYLVSARYGECRCVNGKVLSIFQIACGINEAVVTRKQERRFTIWDLSMAAVEKAIPNGRRDKLRLVAAPANPDPLAYLFVQPLLVLRTKDNQLLLLDGIERFNLLQRRGSKNVRCVIVPERTAVHFGRRGIVVDDAKGRTEELDQRQRSLKGSLPPSIDAGNRYSGQEYDELQRPALSKKRRLSMPALRPDGVAGREKDIAKRDKYLIEHTVLVSPAPHVATIRNHRLHVRVELTKKSKVRRELDLNFENQELLDLIIAFSENVFKKGNAQYSLHEILLIRFLLNLFNKIEMLRATLVSSGLAQRQKSSSRDGVYNPRVGHTIVGEDSRYKEALGRFPDLSEKMKDWAEIPALTHGVYASGLHDGLFDIGLERHHGPRPHGLLTAENHAYALLQAALNALRRAENHTSDLRKIRQHNNGKGSKDELRFDLDYAAEGGDPPERILEEWDVDRSFRALLALHARLNPAKIWRDDTHLTLMYQWLVVLGDLNRHGSMIVTCHMAQEFYLVHGFRSCCENPALNSDWSLFDQALALAVANHPARSKATRELVDLCAAAMVKGRSARVLLDAGGEACFKSTHLSKEVSVLAEAAIWMI